MSVPAADESIAEEAVPAESRTGGAETEALVVDQTSATRAVHAGLADTAASPSVALRSEDGPGPSAKLASISVRVLTGNVFTVVVDIATEHVGHLKAKIEAETGVEPDAQCLTVEGVDDKPLADDGLELSQCDSLKQRGAVLRLALQNTAVAAAWREQRAAALAAWAEALRPGSLVKHAGRLGVVVCMYGASGDRCTATFGEEGEGPRQTFVQPNSHNSVDLRWVDDGTRSVVRGQPGTIEGRSHTQRADGYIKRAVLQCPSAAEFAQHRLAAERAVEDRLSSLGLTERRHCKEYLICLGGTIAIVTCATLAVAMPDWDLGSLQPGTSGSSSDAKEALVRFYEQNALAILALGCGLPCAMCGFGAGRNHFHYGARRQNLGLALEEANVLENVEDPLARVATSNTGEFEVERANEIRTLRKQVDRIGCWFMVYLSCAGCGVCLAWPTVAYTFLVLSDGEDSGEIY
jgi:hypothetical protein